MGKRGEQLSKTKNVLQSKKYNEFKSLIIDCKMGDTFKD